MRCCSRVSRCGAAMAAHSCAMGDVSLFGVCVGARREARGATGTERSGVPEPAVTSCRWTWTHSPRRLRGGGQVGVAPASPQIAPARVANVGDESDRRGRTDEQPTRVPDDDARPARRPPTPSATPRRPSTRPAGGSPRCPAEVVVTNHVMGLYELAAIHLSADEPDLASAALAIDAVACLVDGLGDRLGPEAVDDARRPGQHPPGLRPGQGPGPGELGQLTSVLVDFAATSGRDSSSEAVLGAAEAADGASTTRPPRTVTPSARSSAAWPAAGSVARRPSLRTTRHHGSVEVGAGRAAIRRPGPVRGTRRRRRRRRS